MATYVAISYSLILNAININLDRACHRYWLATWAKLGMDHATQTIWAEASFKFFDLVILMCLKNKRYA